MIYIFIYIYIYMGETPSGGYILSKIFTFFPNFIVKNGQEKPPQICGGFSCFPVLFFFLISAFFWLSFSSLVPTRWGLWLYGGVYIYIYFFFGGGGGGGGGWFGFWRFRVMWGNLTLPSSFFRGCVFCHFVFVFALGLEGLGWCGVQESPQQPNPSFFWF